MKAIVAVDQNWAIGKDGNQLCHISADLKRFKELSMGHPVILGRKTLSTLPGGRPLKGRRNLILSRTASLQIEGTEVYHDIASLLVQAPEDSFVIGGSLRYRLCHQDFPEFFRRSLVPQSGQRPGLADRSRGGTPG